MGALVEPGDNHQRIDHHQVGTGTEDEDECGMNHNAKNHANCQNTPCTALIGNHSGVNGPHEQAGNREQCSGQAGLRKPVGETVVVVGGGEIGCETAMHFALQGKKVSVVEAMPNLMSLEFVPNQCKSMLEDLMEHYHVPVYTGNRLLEINDAGAVIQSADGESKTLEADTVVMSIGMRSNLSMKEALIGTGIEVYEIGSCKKPANIFKAVHDAFELIYNM